MFEQNTINVTVADATDSVNSDPLQNLALYREASITSFEKTALLTTLIECSISAGGYVQLLPEMNYLPALIDSNQNPVFLYEIVEVIDEFIDYDLIQEEYPALTYSQIQGAISFLRKVSQINARDIDIDELEDSIDADNPELLESLRMALNDTEVACVFSND